ALDIGAMTVFFYCFREREKILNLIEAASGGRLTPSYFRIGGLMMDLPSGFERRVQQFQDGFLKSVDEFHTLLTGNRIFQKRTQGEVYHPIEASKGELGVYVKSDGGPKPSRVHFRGPSFVNLSALPLMSEGAMVADIVAIIGSLDIVLGEIDR